MADDIDFAQDLAEAERAAGIAAVRARRPPPNQHRGPTQTRCTRCDDPIPAARAAALPGAGTCVDCQTTIERLARLSRPAGIADA